MKYNQQKCPDNKCAGSLECEEKFVYSGVKVKVKLYPTTGLNKTLGLQDVEGPRNSRQSAHEGGKGVSPAHWPPYKGRGQLKCDGTCEETRFCLSAKRTSPFKLAGASVQLTTGSRGVRISGSNAGYTMFQGGVKSTGYPLHSPVSPSLPLLCVIVCHHISTGLYQQYIIITQ
jgi:hypothetical protein